MVKIILVAHGPLAPALLETASGICCFEQNSVRAYSVSGKADLADDASGSCGLTADAAKSGDLVIESHDKILL